MVRSLMAGSSRMRVEGLTLGRGGAGSHESMNGVLGATTGTGSGWASGAESSRAG